jgi:sec-independent protein translocase protein TatA
LFDTTEEMVWMPGWLGPWEIAIVVVIILLIFGGRLLPKVGSSLGHSLTGLKKGLKEGEEEFKSAIKEDVKVDKPEETSVGSAKQTGNGIDETVAGTEKTE